MKYRSLLVVLLEDFLYNPSQYNHTIYFHQLRDGRIFIFDKSHGLLVTFRYYGTDIIHGLKFHIGEHRDRKESSKLRIAGVEGLKERLDELFPLARETNGRYLYAYEIFLLEGILHDGSTQISIDEKNVSSIWVTMKNELRDVFMKFCYRSHDNILCNWLIVHRGKRIMPEYMRMPDDLVLILDQLFLINEGN